MKGPPPAACPSANTIVLQEPSGSGVPSFIPPVFPVIPRLVHPSPRPFSLPGYKLPQQAKPVECLPELPRLSLAWLIPSLTAYGAATANELSEACISLLCCSCAVWSVQSQARSCKTEPRRPEGEAGQKHMHSSRRTSFMEKGQVNPSSAKDLDSSPRSRSRLPQLWGRSRAPCSCCTGPNA